MSYFTQEESDLIYSLSSEITGLSENTSQKKDVILQNVYARMSKTKNQTLVSYLNLVSSSENEFGNFVSALTIHTTSWFREIEHFQIIKQDILNQFHQLGVRHLNILSLPCSTGEEVYSLAFVLKEIQDQFPLFTFTLFGCDLDPVSIEKAKRAIYLKENISSIPQKYHKHLKMGTGKTEEYFCIDKFIRINCFFSPCDLRHFQPNEIFLTAGIQSQNAKFDIIVCRNVLIYFDQSQINKIIESLLNSLTPQGSLILGHSEKIDENLTHVRHIGNSIYKLPGSLAPKEKLLQKNSANVVFFSLKEDAFVGKSLERFTREFKSISVIKNMNELKLVLEEKQTKVLFVDRREKHDIIETFLKKLIEIQPEIFIAKLFFNEKEHQEKTKLYLSAIYKDYVNWNEIESNPSKLILYTKELLSMLDKKEHSKELKIIESEVHNTTLKRFEGLKPFLAKFNPKYIAIGASTGGVEALTQLLKNMTYKSPPLILVQHLPSSFAENFISLIGKESNLIAVPVKTKTVMQAGHVYVSEGDYHIVVTQDGSNLFIEPNHEPPKNELRPNINILFLSISKLKNKGIGVLLTGMGSDGAMGLLSLKEAGNLTLIQDEVTSVVYGMPKEAAKMGAHSFQGNLQEIRGVIDKMIDKIS